MTRTAIYKGAYFLTIAGGIGVGVWLASTRLYKFDRPGIVFISIAVGAALLIPGRVVGFFWRDLLTGLRLLKRKEFALSKSHSERFLAELGRKPWLKSLIWLASSAYSRDPESMALNNLGAAEIGLGELDTALVHLERAIALDPRNPLPYYNMGLLYAQTGSSLGSDRWFGKAKVLGYTGGITDKIVQAAQQRFAFTDGRAGQERGAPLPDSADADQPAAGDHIVQLLNDDKTPMEFVVWVLEYIFEKTHAEAVEIMLAVHEQGFGECGVHSRREAEARVARMTAFAGRLEFPLACRILPLAALDADRNG